MAGVTRQGPMERVPCGAMRKLIVLAFVSLDGVMQAPGGKGEDPSDGFDLEGWTVPYFDDVAGGVMAKQMGAPFDLLVGRRTYDIFAGYWPNQDNDFFANCRKYVATHRPVESDWSDTVPVTGDVVAEIRKLKDEDRPMLQVHGSANLIQTLLAADLVDELWLKTFPVLLRRGKRLFGEGTRPAAFSLTESTVTPSGVVFASYRRDGDVKTGSFS